MPQKARGPGARRTLVAVVPPHRIAATMRFAGWHGWTRLLHLDYYRAEMSGRASDDTKTATQEETVLPRSGPRRVAVLLVVGRAAEGGGAAEGESVIPFEDAIEIGRNPQCGRYGTVCCLSDTRVSGRHASVSRTRDGFRITDLDSKNGTLVDGRPISAATKVDDGALLFVGGTALVLRLLSEEALAAIREDLAAPFGPVATLSGNMATPIRRLRRLAATDEAILLSGETGVGKEVYARAVHRASGRRGRFVTINCATLPTDLVESELFGFARGAHAQAAAGKPGLVEEAQHGTLFFDEIGEMPSAAQAKLLRFLDDRKYVPLGAGEARTMDVRVIGASSSIVEDQQSQGVRRDLLARFGASPVVLPPLRERREDVGTLVRHFLGQPRGLLVSRLETAAFLALCLHDWPQNVRELEKVMAEAALGADGKPEIRLVDLPARLQERVTVEASSTDHPARRERPDKAELEALLERHKGSVAQVARKLDRQWGVVWRWLQQSGIDAKKYRR